MFLKIYNNFVCVVCRYKKIQKCFFLKMLKVGKGKKLINKKECEKKKRKKMEKKKGEKKWKKKKKMIIKKNDEKKKNRKKRKEKEKRKKMKKRKKDCNLSKINNYIPFLYLICLNKKIGLETAAAVNNKQVQINQCDDHSGTN
ncbi:hypothetical protein RFI_26370 [Reticulomyxa filosa]|uniref:Uncharacterized protein n=1 Tax=Reticulomyxa filosa TaxID=46433 RepID=X6MAH3_RETFI|nr:hypothetical protein RFI_26370 [Reticulomyxa filosa]|eukprot:ETO11003.1 hypothetical protein RFI_26370 [Reticulomyxa filosa]